MKKLLPIVFLFVGITAFSQKQMPNVSLSDLEGKKISVPTDFMEKDKLYIFSFWATWCTPCINELDEMNDVQDTWKKSLAVEIIAVATDDSRTQKRIKPLVNGKGWDYTILLDSNQELKRALGIVNIPYTVVIKNGVIVHIQNGFVPGSDSELFEKLKAL
jgi:peroxiredoxin